jgi:hypothetical protein
MSDGRYHVAVYDRAGEYTHSKTGFDDAGDARQCAARYRATYPDKTVLIHDYERDGRAIDDEDDDG